MSDAFEPDEGEFDADEGEFDAGLVPPVCPIGQFRKKQNCVPCNDTALARRSDNCKLCDQNRKNSSLVFQKYLGWCECDLDFGIKGVFPVTDGQFISYQRSYDECQAEWVCQPGQERPCFPPDKKSWTGFVKSTPALIVIFPVMVLGLSYYYIMRRRAQVVPL